MRPYRLKTAFERAKTHNVISVGEHLSLHYPGYVNGGVAVAKKIAGVLAEKFSS